MIRDRSGDLGAADAGELGVVELRLAFVPADRASTGPRTISVLAMSSQWLATARAAAGGCPWIRLRSGAGGDAVTAGTATGSCAAGRIAASVGASRDTAP